MTDFSLKRWTPVVWADATDFNSSVSGLTRTHQIDLTGILFGEAYMGAAADLGTTRAALYTVRACVEFKTGEAPESGELCNIYFVSSAAASSGFPIEVTGSSGAYTGTTGDSLADSLATVRLRFPFILTSDATPQLQVQDLGVLRGDEVDQYVVPIFENATDAEDLHTDAVEMYVALIPWVTTDGA